MMRIRNFFSKDTNVFDLGKLQKYNLIKLEELHYCPKCRSKNIEWKFLIPTDGSKPTFDHTEICKDCDYKDKRGGFKITNMSLIRENKINQVLYGKTN